MTSRSTPRPDMGRPQPPRIQHGSRWLKLVGITALGLGALLFGMVMFLIVGSPVNGVREQLIREVKSRTGRDLLIGSTSLVFLPGLSVSFSNLALSAPRDMGGAPTLTAKTLDAEIGLLSLLFGQGGVKRLVLTQPWLDLRVDAQGRRSWDLALATPSRTQFTQWR